VVWGEPTELAGGVSDAGGMGVKAYWRDLFLGVGAWYCGNLAVNQFPVTGMRMDRLSVLITLLLYKPLSVMMSVIFFLLGSWILYELLMRHGRMVVRRSVPRIAEWRLHLLLLLFTGYLILWQLWKMPVPTIGLALIILLLHVHTAWRDRRLRRELQEFRQEKK